MKLFVGGAAGSASVIPGMMLNSHTCKGIYTPGAFTTCECGCAQCRRLWPARRSALHARCYLWQAHFVVGIGARADAAHRLHALTGEPSSTVYVVLYLVLHIPCI